MILINLLRDHPVIFSLVYVLVAIGINWNLHGFGHDSFSIEDHFTVIFWPTVIPVIIGILVLSFLLASPYLISLIVRRGLIKLLERSSQH